MSVGNPSGPADPSGTPGPAGTSEVRRLDASALKAYAHPLRLRMIRYLNDHGSATATTLAAHLGESTGQTSYHLRQLARHGLVEDDPTRGSGRERWWRPTSFEVDATELVDPALAPAAHAMLQSVAQSRAESMAAWMATAPHAPRHWVDASVHSQSTMHLTSQEAAEITEAVQAVLKRYSERSRGRERAGELGDPADADGVQRVRLYYDSFPLLASQEGAATDSASQESAGTTAGTGTLEDGTTTAGHEPA